MWLDQTFKVLPQFHATMKSVYGIEANLLNFKDEPEQSTYKINQQVSEETNH